MDITLTLNEAEITDAIKEFVKSKSPIQVNGALDVNIIASKSAAGCSAVIKISDTPIEAPEPAAKNKVAKTSGKDVTPQTFDEPKVSEGLKAAMDEPGEEVNPFGDMPIDNTGADLDMLFGSSNAGQA